MKQRKGQPVPFYDDTKFWKYFANFLTSLRPYCFFMRESGLTEDQRGDLLEKLVALPPRQQIRKLNECMLKRLSLGEDLAKVEPFSFVSGRKAEVLSASGEQQVVHSMLRRTEYLESDQRLGVIRDYVNSRWALNHGGPLWFCTLFSDNGCKPVDFNEAWSRLEHHLTQLNRSRLAPETERAALMRFANNTVYPPGCCEHQPPIPDFNVARPDRKAEVQKKTLFEVEQWIRKNMGIEQFAARERIAWEAYGEQEIIDHCTGVNAGRIL